MVIALEIALIVTLMVLSVGIVPLLLQLRRTANGVNALVLASKQNHSSFADVVDHRLQPRLTSARERTTPDPRALHTYR